MGGQCWLNVALMNDQSMVSHRDWSEPLTVQNSRTLAWDGLSVLVKANFDVMKLVAVGSMVVGEDFLLLLL